MCIRDRQQEARGKRHRGRDRRVPGGGQLPLVHAVLGAQVGGQRVVRAEFLHDGPRGRLGQPLTTVDVDQLVELLLGGVLQVVAFLGDQPTSVSRWLDTDTYSPMAIAEAPASRPATPASMTADRLAGSAAATPMVMPAPDTTPSLAPSTAARSQFSLAPRPPNPTVSRDSCWLSAVPSCMMNSALWG